MLVMNIIGLAVAVNDVPPMKMQQPGLTRLLPAQWPSQSTALGRYAA